MPPDPNPPNGVCPEKISLLRGYVYQLHLHNEDVREYANYVICGLDGDGLTNLKERMAESKDRFQDARKSYTDHRREHGC